MPGEHSVLTGEEEAENAAVRRDRPMFGWVKRVEGFSRGFFVAATFVIVLAIALLIFGPKRLPEVGKGLGTAIRGFKDGLSGKGEQPAKGEPEAKDAPKTPAA
jgi:sec-independent protein translocase protein TatA